ncbi:MAG: NAD(P)/FAD-dependent oxidoreductase [Candidatus Marinimicrobia bacterium]|nr:NAD(P)/FAD-dependent oxidoreductase [Candidatus Neomarinimicrobiota bacterium]
MEHKTVLILGGGVGGLVTANNLRKSLGKEHRIIVIDQDRQHRFAPSFLWLMTGLRKPEKICRDLNSLSKKGIEFVEGKIAQFDAKSKTVEVNGRQFSGDYVVVSLGANLVPDSVPGLETTGHNFYTMEGAEGLRDALRNFKSGDLVVLITSIPYKCPAAPYEAAMLLEYDCRKRKIRDDVNISLYAAEPGPMGVAGKELSAAVRKMVEDKGIHFYPEHHLESVGTKEKMLHFSNGTEAHFDFLAYVPKHEVPEVVREAGLVGESGWVKVDRNSMETKFPGVFSIGDVTGIPLALGKPLPKAGVFAHYQAEVVAHNIAVDITGKGKTKQFSGAGECFVEIGDGKAGFARGNFYAEPLPQVKMYRPGRYWHAGKVLFEKDWLRRWF